MPRVPTVRKADLDRVLRSLKDAGQVAGQVVVRPGGEVVITPAPAGTTLTAPTLSGEPANLEQWRAMRRGGDAT